MLVDPGRAVPMTGYKTEASCLQEMVFESAHHERGVSLAELPNQRFESEAALGWQAGCGKILPSRSRFFSVSRHGAQSRICARPRQGRAGYEQGGLAPLMTRCDWPLLRGHFARRKIVLGRNAEGIGNAVEESEQCCDVHSFGDLIFTPARVPKLLHIVGCRAGGGVRDQFHIIKKNSFGRSQAGAFQLALQNRRYTLITGSLNTQEVSVAVQSIGTPVQVGNVARDHLLVSARQVACGEVDGVGEVHHLAQEVGARPKALDDAGHLVTSGAGTPVVVSRGGVSGGLSILDDLDFCGLAHSPAPLRGQHWPFVAFHALDPTVSLAVL